MPEANEDFVRGGGGDSYGQKTELLVARLRGDVWTDELDAARATAAAAAPSWGAPRRRRPPRAALVGGCDTGGWEAEVRPHLSVFPSMSTRWPSRAAGRRGGYDIQATETLTLTLPACALRDAARDLPAGSFALSRWRRRSRSTARWSRRT